MAIRKYIYTTDGGGIDAIIKDYKSFEKVTTEEMERIMEEAGDIILDVTSEFVPIDTGALLESGFSMLVETGSRVEVDVGFGGSDNPVTPTENAPDGIVFYAALVNENPEGDGFKFFERGIEASRDEVNAFIEQEVKEVMETQRRKSRRGRRKK